MLTEWIVPQAAQDHYFPHDYVFSAATSLEKPTTKPNPAIYLHACKHIGVHPGECVAVEDSKSGATAAFRAGIPCIAYVGCYHGAKKQKEIAEVLTGPGEWLENCQATVFAFADFAQVSNVRPSCTTGQSSRNAWLRSRPGKQLIP